MITKERLEELIKEKATIYRIRDSMIDDYQLCSCNYLENNELIYGNVLTNYCIRGIGKLEDFFETEEDAEFALNYQNITRTETLSLPTWEEIEKEEFYKLYFYNSLGREFCLQVENYGSGDNICVSCSNDYNDLYEIFDRPITKENYLSACELCRKLFLGEVE